MAYITIANTFTRGTVVKAGDINTNTQDIISGISDGSKDANVKTVAAQTMNVANQAGALSLNFSEKAWNYNVMGSLSCHVQSNGGEVNVVIPYHAHGSHVCLNIPVFTITTLATGSFKTDSALPTAIWPKVAQRTYFTPINDGTLSSVLGYISVSALGIITFFFHLVGYNWAATTGGNTSGPKFAIPVTYSRGV